MGQMLHAKAAPINVRPAQEVTSIAFLVQQVVLALTVHALMPQHTTMVKMLHAITAHINVLHALKVTPIVFLVQQVVLALTVHVP